MIRLAQIGIAVAVAYPIGLHVIALLNSITSAMGAF